MISRRKFMAWLGGLTLGGLSTFTYAAVIEPDFRLRTVTYKFTPPRWTPGLKLRVVMLADPHLVEPHMSLSRWQNIIKAANALQPDVHLLLGDYVTAHPFRTAKVPVVQCAEAAKSLSSTLGTFAICGNHDWWEDPIAQKLGHGPTATQTAFENAGITVLENKAIQLKKVVCPFGFLALPPLWQFESPTGNLKAEPICRRHWLRSLMMHPSFTWHMSRICSRKCQSAFRSPSPATPMAAKCASSATRPSCRRLMAIALPMAILLKMAGICWFRAVLEFQQSRCASASRPKSPY